MTKRKEPAPKCHLSDIHNVLLQFEQEINNTCTVEEQVSVRTFRQMIDAVYESGYAEGYEVGLEMAKVKAQAEGD